VQKKNGAEAELNMGFLSIEDTVDGFCESSS
jgi:hypothetical protein